MSLKSLAGRAGRGQKGRSYRENQVVVCAARTVVGRGVWCKDDAWRQVIDAKCLKE